MRVNRLLNESEWVYSLASPNERWTPAEPRDTDKVLSGQTWWMDDVQQLDPYYLAITVIVDELFSQESVE